MYRVTFTAANKDMLATIIDRVLRTEGAKLEACEWLGAVTAAPPKAQKEPKKKKQRGKGTNVGALIEVISQAFGEGEWAPKQIKSLAVSRGVPKNSFYGALGDAEKQGLIAKVKLGIYKLTKRSKDDGKDGTSEAGEKTRARRNAG